MGKSYLNSYYGCTSTGSTGLITLHMLKTRKHWLKLKTNRVFKCGNFTVFWMIYMHFNG